MAHGWRWLRYIVRMRHIVRMRQEGCGVVVEALLESCEGRIVLLLNRVRKRPDPKVFCMLNSQMTV